MHEYWSWALVFLAGLALGAFFFGGLWWTTNRGIRSKQPWLLFGTSLLLRSGLVLGGFYIIGGADSARFLICLSGFVCARIIAARLSRTPASQ